MADKVDAPAEAVGADEPQVTGPTSTNLENEIESALEEAPSEEVNDSPASDVGEGSGEEGNDGSGDIAGNQGDSDDEGRSVGDDDAAPIPPPSPAPEYNQPAPELDTDISIPADHKIVLQGFDKDGNPKEFYLTSTADLAKLPKSGFEPANYPHLMAVSAELARRAVREEDADAARTSLEQETQAREQAAREAEDLRNTWTGEAEELAKNGQLPSVPKTAKEQNDPEHPYNKRVNEVKEFMREELKAKRPLQSFVHALGLLEAKELKAEKATKQKEIDERKKRSGSLVMGSGSGNSTPSTGLRPGMSVDAVIDEALAT